MAYTEITDRALSVIKGPPIEPPTIPMYNSALPASRDNNLLENIFQFRFRFIYCDKEKSVWGPVSSVPANETTHTTTTTTTGLDEASNYNNTFYTSNGYPTEEQFYTYDITLDVDIPEDTTLDFMDVAVRRTNIGTWNYVETIDVTAYRGQTYTYTFDNSKVLLAMDQADVNRPYDYVPQRAGAQQIIGGKDGNYLVYGDITEGYYNLPNDLDVTLTALAKGGVEDNMYRLVTETFLPRTVVINDMGPANSSPEIYICGNGEIHRYSHPTRRFWNENTGLVDTMTVNNVRNFFIQEIEKDELVASVSLGAGNSLIIVFEDMVEDFEAGGYAYASSVAWRSLKKGATSYFGVVYRDEFGRQGAVQTDDTLELIIPSPSEDGGSCNTSHWLTLTLAHVPPIWAYSWELVYGGNDILWFQQMLLRTHDRSDRSLFLEDGRLKIKINEGINNVRDQLQGYVYPNYIWNEGDRIRILGTKDFDGTTGCRREEDYYDVKIDWFDGVYLYAPYWGKGYDFPDLSEGKDFLVEVYRKRKDSEERIYRGVGIGGAITNPGGPSTGAGARVHSDATARDCPIAITYVAPHAIAYNPELGPYSGDGADTTTTTTTSTTETRGYDRYESHAGIISVKFESYWISLFMKDSDVAGVGQVHIEDPDADTKRLNNIRYSGIYISKTFVNKLNRFDYDDDEVFDDKFGTLFGLAEVGYTLKVLQRSKLTSLYIGREMSLDAKGNEQMIYTDNVLGSKYPASTTYGTEHPDSILVTDRYMYFYDINAGCVVRDSANGQEEISRYGMESYFKDLSRLMASKYASGRVNVVTGYDSDNDLVYFTFRDPAEGYDDQQVWDSDSVTLSFSEENNRWVGFHSFIPDGYQNVGGKYLFTFIGGYLFKQNVPDVNRCKYYAVDYNQELWVVANENPAVIKSYEAIELVSNQLWTAPDNDSIVIPANSRYPGGMQSLLREADFEQYEGVFRAPFNKDLLTGDNATANNYYLYNGRNLRGRAMVIKLENDKTDEVNLFIVKVLGNMSP